MEKRQTLHTLVDELPEEELSAAKRFLEFLRQQLEDPLGSMLKSAPVDDEPVSGEDLAAIREGLGQKARREVVSHEEVIDLLRRAP